jgi:hypothetical protein
MGALFSLREELLGRGLRFLRAVRCHHPVYFLGTGGFFVELERGDSAANDQLRDELILSMPGFLQVRILVYRRWASERAAWCDVLRAGRASSVTRRCTHECACATWYFDY